MRGTVGSLLGHTSVALLGSTALSLCLLANVQQSTAAEPGSQKPAVKRTVSEQTRTKTPALSPEIRRAIAEAFPQGPAGLIAAVFDQVHHAPRSRDAVLSYAASLAPALQSNLAKAADIGVLTAGKTLALAAPRGHAFAASPNSIAGFRSADVAPRAVIGVNTQFANQYGLGLIKADAAYTAGFTGAGVIVGVGDTGVDTGHPALAGKIDSRSRNYLVINSNSTYDPAQLGPLDPSDEHGSHVSGIIAATNDETATAGMHGVAFDAKLLTMRMIPAVDANGSIDAIEPQRDALNYLATLNDVRVFNASYGPNIANTPTLTVWPSTVINTLEQGAAQNALAAGKIIVAATGNDRQSHPVAGLNPNGLALYPFIRPGHANLGVYVDGGNNYDFSAMQKQPGLIIGVTAIDQNKAAGSFANFCGVTASWCVAAPGVNVLSSVPTTVDASGYQAISGTSMAAPHVSGAIAILIQAYPDYSSQELARLLFATAEDLGAAGVDAKFGYGLIRLDRALAGPTSLAAGANVGVAASQTDYWSRQLTTSGAFTKSGDGDLIIAGRITAGGNVAVNAGSLGVDGTLALNAFTLNVEQNAVLAGIGRINGNTTISGTLSPGQLPNVQDQIANNGLAAGTVGLAPSPGTLTFAGNVTLSSTATTVINIDGKLLVPGGPGTWSKIVITGAGNTFTAGGTLLPVLRGISGGNNTYVPELGDAFQILTAESGAKLAGKIATLTQPTADLGTNQRFDLVDIPNGAMLAVTPVKFADIKLPGGKPLTSAQQAIAAGLDKSRAQAKAVRDDSDVLLEALFLLDSEDAYTSALTQLTGPGAPATPGAVLAGFAAFANIIAGRQSLLQSGGAGAQAAATPGVSFAFEGGGANIATHPAMMAFAGVDSAQPSTGRNTWAIWGQAFGRWSRVGNSADLPGSTSRSGGFALGADRYLTSDWLAGLAFGFTRTTTNSGAMDATTDSYSGAVYTSWTPGRWAFDARAAIGPTKIGTSRTMNLTPSSINGNANGLAALIGGEAGYRIPIGIATLKPFVGLDWQMLRRNGYEETTAFGLSYPTQTFTKITTKLGVASSVKFQSHGMTYLPELRAAWAHDLRDTTLTTQAALLDSPFEVDAASPGRDAALIDLSLTAWRSEQFRVFASVGGEYRHNAVSHQIAGGVRYAW